SFLVSLLIVLAVQQDGLVGTRPDWLTRPVRNRDLLLAKLLSVLLAVQLPLFGCDLGEALWRDFPLSVALGAAAADAVQNFLTLSLSAMAVAAVTENAIQAIIVLLLVNLASTAAMSLTEMT